MEHKISKGSCSPLSKVYSFFFNSLCLFVSYFCLHGMSLFIFAYLFLFVSFGVSVYICVERRFHAFTQALGLQSNSHSEAVSNNRRACAFLPLPLTKLPEAFPSSRKSVAGVIWQILRMLHIAFAAPPTPPPALQPQPKVCQHACANGRAPEVVLCPSDT